MLSHDAENDSDVLGLLAGAHICAGHGERLTAAGAECVFDSFDEAKVFTEETLLRLSSP